MSGDRPSVGEALRAHASVICLQCLSHTGPSPAHSACALPAHIAQALGCTAGNCLRPSLGCMHLPGLSCSGSGTRVVLRGTDSVGPAFCALPRSEQLTHSSSEVDDRFSANTAENKQIEASRNMFLLKVCNIKPAVAFISKEKQLLIIRTF